MARWVLRLHGIPPLPNRMAALPLRARMIARARWRDDTAAVARSLQIPRLAAPIVTYTRYSTAEPDFDGLVASFKHVQDGLVVAGVLPDDAPKHLRPAYGWHACRRGEEHIEIAIEGVEAEGAA